MPTILSVAAYERMAELGLVEEKTELIRGVILEKPVNSPLHSALVQLLTELLQSHVPAHCSLRLEQPLRLQDSCPEPDIAIVNGHARQFLKSHPTSALFVLEIAISSEMLDRAKAAIYAKAGVSEYWILLPERATIERFSQPGPSGYTAHQSFSHDEPALSLTLHGFSVSAASLLQGS
jgi:Uma2 family endonuclease